MSEVSSQATCVVIHPSESYTSKQGIDNLVGVSAQTVGAKGLGLHLQTFPPGFRAKAHLHAHHETAIYVVQGTIEIWYGAGLRERLSATGGDFIYIPAGIPHLPTNPSQTEKAVVVLARTDPNEQESVVLLPELDASVG